MRVLLIAPTHPDLPAIDAEAAAIARWHDVQRVSRDADILLAIEAGNLVDVLWFASHGGPLGIQLSDSILSPDALGQYLSAAGARLCVLNTCDSEAVAMRIIAGGKTDLIFTISADVRDADALRFGTLLAKELGRTDDLEDAFRVAAGPGETKYRYLRAKYVLRGRPTAARPSRAQTAQLAMQLDLLSGRVDELNLAIRAVIFYGLLILIVVVGVTVFVGDRQVNGLSDRLHRVEEQIQYLQLAPGSGPR